jgi:hypothetical protein
MHLPETSGWRICALPVLPMRPGDFALGSNRSRAAARAALERRFTSRRRIDAVSSVPRPGGDGGIHIGTWMECEDGSLYRFSTIPAGVTIEEAERIASQPGWKPTALPSTPERIRPPIKPEW